MLLLLQAAITGGQCMLRSKKGGAGQCGGAMTQRKKVGMLFAYLKRILRRGGLCLRSPNGANEGFLFAVTAQNVCNLVRMLSAPQQRQEA